MAENISKVIYGGRTLIDLTQDTVTPENILKGFTTHDASGAPITGTCEFDSNTQDANATAAEILKNKTVYARGTKLTGSMPNNGAVTGTITTKNGEYKVPHGYHDGSGTVKIAASEQEKIIAENIRQGVTILGVEGSMSGTEGAKAQSREVTPSMQEQVILPGSGYNYLSQVTVKPIPYTETQNAAGGITVAIG